MLVITSATGVDYDEVLSSSKAQEAQALGKTKALYYLIHRPNYMHVWKIFK